ncbi:MAG: serine kinase [Spirochaetes bacterium]|nr:serine kinase [Spirochaetota bacterium]
MELKEIVNNLNLDVKTCAGNLDIKITSGYSSDLLSDVMGNASTGDIWITLQSHQNIVAVAVMKSLSAIILINGKEPEEATIKKAEEEKVTILSSKLPAFELIGKLYEMGISGSK